MRRVVEAVVDPVRDVVELLLILGVLAKELQGGGGNEQICVKLHVLRTSKWPIATY